MNKEPKTLPQAIKIVVGKYGKDIVNDVRMVNIINDVVSLEDPNAVKSILRDCLRLGYGGKILAIKPHEDYHLKTKSLSKDIVDSHGYKEDLVQYVLESFVFGLGTSQQVPCLQNHKKQKTHKICQLISKDEEVILEDTKQINYEKGDQEDNETSIKDKIATIIGTIIGIVVTCIILSLPVLGIICLLNDQPLLGITLLPIGLLGYLFALNLMQKHETS